ncbi:MAG: M28 family peptidase [Myxococcota bacterium]
MFSGFILASFISAGSPTLAFLIAALCLFFNWAEHTTQFEGLGQFLPKRSSQNVVGRRRAEGARAHVVVTCHYDTSRTGLPYTPALVRHFRSSFLSSLVAQVGLTLVFFIRIFNGDGFLLDAFQVLATIYLMYGVAIMVDREVRGEYVNGANDNASGVAAMLALADRFVKDPPAGLDLWFLANGCEEVGMTGQRHFLLNHAHELPPERTFFLNIDNIGSGRLRYCTGEGMIKFFPYSPTLIHLASQVALSAPFQDVSPHPYRRAYFDALVPAARGYGALSLIALDEDDQIPNWHWHTDTIENVDMDAVKKGADFAEQIIRRLDGQA